jgi:hypothetical protein
MQLGGLKGVVFREFDVDFELATCVGWIIGSTNPGHPAKRFNRYGYLRGSISFSSMVTPGSGSVMISIRSFSILSRFGIWRMFTICSITSLVVLVGCQS